jgi:hypothetical protein
MRKLSRDEMKNVIGGLNTTADDGVDCTLKKCADNLGAGGCGGNSTCKCETACIYCKAK